MQIELKQGNSSNRLDIGAGIVLESGSTMYREEITVPPLDTFISTISTQNNTAVSRMRCLITAASLLGVVSIGLLAGRPALAQKATDPGDPPEATIEAAQTPPAAASPVINFRERPIVKSEAQRLRRTPTIDGVFSQGEWDSFYTVSDGPITGTVYCNWDDNFLYLATRTDRPATLVFDVDGGGDGWLRGADNLEIVIGSVGGVTPPSISARVLDAANSKDAPAWLEKNIDVKSISFAGKVVNGEQFVEVAIPKSLGSLVLRAGVTLGLRAEFLPAGATYTPTQPYEPHLLLDATLVDSRAQPAVGINPKLVLSASRCVAGQKLFATFELYNQTDVNVPLKSLTWAGQGSSASAVNMLREVTIAPIPPFRRVKYGYKTVLPADLSVGSYTLTATAETADGKQIQSTAAFSVVEPLQVQLTIDPDPILILGPTRFDLVISVFSAAPFTVKGDIEFTTVPPGFELEDKRPRIPITADKENSKATRRIGVKIPSTIPAGDYTFEANVRWNKRIWKVRQVAHLTRPEPKTPDAK